MQRYSKPRDPSHPRSCTGECLVFIDASEVLPEIPIIAAIWCSDVPSPAAAERDPQPR